MLLTDIEKIAEVMGDIDDVTKTKVLDLMFYARKDGYYRAYEEVAKDKKYQEDLAERSKQWA